MDLGCVSGCFPILCPLLPQEDCDLENVWLMGGLSVLTSVPGGPPMVCLLCASKGLHEVGALPFFKKKKKKTVLASKSPFAFPDLDLSARDHLLAASLSIISLLLLVGLLPSLL